MAIDHLKQQIDAAKKTVEAAIPQRPAFQKDGKPPMPSKRPEPPKDGKHPEPPKEVKNAPCPPPAVHTPTENKKPEKSVDELAREVIRGLWGNGAERKTRLTEAGYDFDAVQKRVNELLK